MQHTNLFLTVDLTTYTFKVKVQPLNSDGTPKGYTDELSSGHTLSEALTQAAHRMHGFELRIPLQVE